MMENFINNNEDLKENSNDFSLITTAVKKQITFEDTTQRCKFQLKNSTPYYLSTKEKNNCVNSNYNNNNNNGIVDESAFQISVSPTNISDNYEQLSTLAEDEESSVNNFIINKLSESNILETVSNNINYNSIYEKDNTNFGSSQESIKGLKLPLEAIFNKSIKRKSSNEQVSDFEPKNQKKKFNTNQSREKILKLDSGNIDISVDYNKSVGDIKQTHTKHSIDKHDQFSDMASQSEEINDNESLKPVYQSAIKINSKNMLNDNIEKKLISNMSEELLNSSNTKLVQSHINSVKEDNPVCSPVHEKATVETSPSSTPGSGTPNRLSIDTDEISPIHAEVVMSDISENEQLIDDDDDKNNGDKTTDQVQKDVEHYLSSFINCSQEGNVIEYPPLHNEIPKDCSDVTMWQMENVSLPPFKPFLDPPSWIRLTIPPEGYKCISCGDIFFIESSLIQHKERRSVWITFDCGPCDAKLTFYNKCAFKCHIQNHTQSGEQVEYDSVVVRTLPLQLMKLLQPLIVPVPKLLWPMKNKNGSSAKSLSKSSSLFHHRTSTKERPSSDSQDYSATEIAPQMSGLPTCFNESLTSKKTVKCYLCDRMFYSVRELMSHMRTNQGSSDQRVECRKCLLVLPSVCAAKAHILTHPPANFTNISVCPECGSRCEGPRDFVHHLNTCGHQYRRSGILCQQCKVSFFKFSDDFISHWIKEHCSKSYECVVCFNIFESLVFHKCNSPGNQVFATFKCLLTCPLCPHVVQLHTQEERETLEKIRAHLSESHPAIINRVYYVYKSKFCTNAFRTKDELRAHHDREHRRDNHYRTKTCTLYHEVLGFQHQYFNGQEPRNAFVSLSVLLSQEEMEEAQTMDVPTVTSVVDTPLFPQGPVILETLKTFNIKEKMRESEKSSLKTLSSNFSPSKKNLFVENLRPYVCYRCGYTYTSSKDIRKHKRDCEGESSQRLCQICGVEAIGEEFSQHCKTHIEEGSVLCIYCNGAPFSSSEVLFKHFELHVHEQFSYPAQCPFCPYIMSDVTTALSHIQGEHNWTSNIDSSNVECDHCHRKFHSDRGLGVHLTRCTAAIISPNNANSVNNVAYIGSSSTTKQCLICKKGLSPEMYGKHIISHLEEGLLVCSLCDGLSFPTSTSLLRHLEEHSSNLELPFLCPICSYTMSTSHDAFIHLKEDHGFGNLNCPDCEMLYHFTYQLQRHIDIVHKICLYAKRRYICWICRAYDHVKKETLMSHFSSVHGLAKEEVDEKVMIRTRGHGTMPTSQFIPTKPLGSKELGDGKARFTSEKKKSSENSVQSKLADSNDSVTVNSTRTCVQNVIIKKEALDIIKNASDYVAFEPEENVDIKIKLEPIDMDLVPESNESNAKSVVNSSSDVKKRNSSKISMKINKKNFAKMKDKKLRDRTKVMIKRLPDSTFRSRTIDNGVKETVTKDIKLKKKKKYNCDRCSYGTNYMEKMEYHKSKHKINGTDGFLCGECGQSFVVEPSLKRHMFFAHRIKQNPQSVNKSLEYTVEINNCEGGVNSKTICKKKNSKSAKIHELKASDLSKKTRKSDADHHQRITIKIKRSPAKIKSDEVKVKNEEEKKEEGERSDNLQCPVCQEVFLTAVQLYSHLRTHGMAFLKHGRKKRNFIQEKASSLC